MDAATLRFLFAYDRWASKKVLEAAHDVDDEVWEERNAIGERGLGGILVHALGAHQRWRHGLSGSDLSPRPEREPLPTILTLRDAWRQEWEALDAWLAELDDQAVNELRDGIPVWQMLVHVVNHGTQHRAEAAALLTAAGCSPGDLDLIFFAEEQAQA